MKLLILLIFLITNIFAKSIDTNNELVLKYLFTKGKAVKGELVIKNKKGELISYYYNITKSDKIPFFAKQKEFKYKVLSNKLIFDRLNNDGLKKYFIYNLTDAHSDLLDTIGMSQSDVPNSSIILDSDKEPEYSVDKIQVLSAESLLLAIATDTINLKQQFYLYEPTKKILFKVKLVNLGSKTIKVAGKNVKTKLWQLRLVKGKKKLLNIYLTKAHTPVKMESTKKRWSFDLIAAGNSRIIKYDYLPFIYKNGKNRLDKMVNKPYKILSKEYQEDRQNHIYSFNISQKMGKFRRSELKQYLNNNFIVKNNDFKNSYKKISLNDTIDYIQKYEGMIQEDGALFKVLESKRYKTLDLDKQYGKKNGCKIHIMQLYCDEDSDEPTILTQSDYKDIIEESFSTDIEELVLDDVMGSVTVKYYKQKKLSSDQFKQFALDAMGLDGVSISKVSYNSDDNIFYINLDYNKINKDRCKKEAKRLHSNQYSYNKNICRVDNVIVKLNKDKIFQKVKESIYKKHIDFKWLKNKINKIDSHTVEYKTIDGFKGLDDDQL